jgi:hypothetical protein
MDINPISRQIVYNKNNSQSALQLLSDVTVSELLTNIITPALQIRKQEWANNIGQKLKDLEESHSLQLEDLSSNQQFIDTVLQSTNYAIKTSDLDKIEIFKNVIINAALGDTPNQTLTQIFLNLIDSFTTWHIKILKLFDNPTEWFNVNNKSLPNYAAASLTSVITGAFPELGAENELLDLIWSDINRAGLTNTSGIRTTMTGSGLLAERTTKLGKQFLDFISTKNQ